MGGNTLVSLEDDDHIHHENNISGFFGEEDFLDHHHHHHHSSDASSIYFDDIESDDSPESSHDPEERTQYWDSQESLLQEILEHYSSTGSKLRQELIRIIEMVREIDFCECPKLHSHGCAKCLRRRVVHLLCNKRFNATLFTSKWKHSQKLPGGTHEYIEVIASTQGRKKQGPMLIELEFKDQFKMAIACDEYHRLIDQLPEIFIGKPEHLDAIVRVVCDAAKRSAAEKDIHMGPWRKRSFMQMKWSASNKRLLSHEQSSNELPMTSSARQVHVPTTVRSFFQFSTAVEVA
ncbi:uncharacterized protein LOC132273913 [Cornus florida]|uniref:uncharacterized protein LOC132273913 n=1 Tax=Cornus florida TaxID=4283 RepID=UPI00289E58A8|nr:uncharacterized protein LOC132273913 [Cornus florida]